MLVFVTGATGLIGRRLVRALVARGDRVRALSRKPLPLDTFGGGPGACEPVVGDPCRAGPWLDGLAECDAVVHLSGEPILAKRWSDEFLQTVKESRTQSTRLIAERLATTPSLAGGTPRAFVSGSAVGYYGINTGDAEKTEADGPGSDVLADICTAWEEAAAPAVAAGVRVSHPRTGVVLDPDGGALPQMALPFKLFVGGRIGDGTAYLPWVHHADMTGLLLHALDTALHGPFNACSPHPVTGREFAATLAKVLGRPNLFPMPLAALRVLLGRAAEVAAGGQRVLPAAVLASGYQFRFPFLEPSLRDLLGK